MKATSPKLRDKLRGVALVEMVVVTPILLFLILATAEVTNAFVDHNTLSKSVRNAARYLASNSILGTTGIVVVTMTASNETRNLAVYGNTAGTGAPVLSGFAVGDVQISDVGNNNVQVTATYPYTGLLGGTLPNFGLGGSLDLTMNLQATVTMRAL